MIGKGAGPFFCLFLFLLLIPFGQLPALSRGTRRTARGAAPPAGHLAQPPKIGGRCARGVENYPPKKEKLFIRENSQRFASAPAGPNNDKNQAQPLVSAK